MNVSFSYTVEQVAEITKGRWINRNNHNLQPSYLSLDSRKVVFADTTIFFAIKSARLNANLFIEALYKKGVRNFVTDEDPVNLDNISLANIIVVPDTVNALQKLAIFHRHQFHNQFPVIGVTGSNGKTVVKEWLYQLLEKDISIIRSPKSFNSQIGVPLSILNIHASNDLGIFEAGISLPGEMKKLEKIIQPDIGVLTNIGNAHDEGFKNRKQKIQEKLLLFQHCRYLIFCDDDKDVADEIIIFQQKHAQLQLFSWGKEHHANLQIKNIKKDKFSSVIEAVYNRKKVSVEIPFIDEASVQNAISCWCTLLVLNRNSDHVLKRFNKLYPLAMRLELKQGINHCTIINDSYSNDLYSLGIALDFLNQQKQHAVHTIILSDILQSGRKADELYQNVASLLQHSKIDRLFGIGSEIFAHQDEFSFLKNKMFFKSTGEFLQHISALHFKDETVLIKGARQFEFEKIGHLLEQKAHQTVLSVNLSALVYNLNKYRERLKPATKIMAMVKAFSYGSGSYEIASVLEFNKVDYLAVAYADEGVELRKAGISLPVMVMNIDDNSFDAVINYSLEPEIFSFALLNNFISHLKTAELDNYPIHLKIDTGMHRLGFLEQDIDELCKIVSRNKFIKVNSVFSHLAASEDEHHDDFTLQQADLFRKCCQKIEQALGYPFLGHIDNTSGISRHPDLQMDMVRLGIGLYGIDGNKKMQKRLKNVSTLTTTISQIKKIKAGETVGYGRNALLEKDSIIAVVRIGYADGFSRKLGNGNGKMLVKNKLVPVVGNVCMDMAMLDISGIKNVYEGDEVVVFGEALSLQTLATWAQTIPYEIMTGISQRVKRIYFEE